MCWPLFYIQTHLQRMDLTAIANSGRLVFVS